MTLTNYYNHKSITIEDSLILEKVEFALEDYVNPSTKQIAVITLAIIEDLTNSIE